MHGKTFQLKLKIKPKKPKPSQLSLEHPPVAIDTRPETLFSIYPYVIKKGRTLYEFKIKDSLFWLWVLVAFESNHSYRFFLFV